MELIKLPLACTVHYCSEFMTTFDADQLFQQIRTDYDLSDTVVQVMNGPTITMDTGRCILRMQILLMRILYRQGLIVRTTGPQLYWRLSSVLKR